MILSFQDDWLRNFFVEDIRSKKIPSELESRLFGKLHMIDGATTDQDLRGATQQKLHSNLAGFHFDPRQQHNGGSFSSGMPGEVRRKTSIWTTIVISEVRILTTKRKSASVGEILMEECQVPLFSGDPRRTLPALNRSKRRTADRSR